MTALEDYVTHLAKRSKEIHVVTGTAYLPDDEGRVTYKTIGRNKVSVPTHFYKVWVRLDANGRLSMEAFKLPNNGDVKLNSPLAPFRISIKSDLPNLERSVGLIFFNRIDRKAVEKPSYFQLGFVDWTGDPSMASSQQASSSHLNAFGGFEHRSRDTTIDQDQGSMREQLLNEMLSQKAHLTQIQQEQRSMQEQTLDMLVDMMQSQQSIIARIQHEQRLIQDQSQGQLQAMILAHKNDIDETVEAQQSVNSQILWELRSLEQTLAQVKRDIQSLNAN